GRSRVVVEVRDARPGAVARRARRELVHATHADAAAAGVGRRGPHAVRLGPCTGTDAAVVQVVVDVIAEATAGLIDRVPARLPDVVDVVSGDGVGQRVGARAVDAAARAQAVGRARITRLQRRVVEHVAAAV